MRGMTVASRPGPFLGVMGALLVALGVVLALTGDDWVPLIISMTGVPLIVMALVAQRPARG